ncbi:hypothetical protein, partial [Holdemanella sp. DFI.5.21]|uniref:hypothetical protein n=1 Tax=Holdemanella sp. DFI.5.21 TaxID=2916964 RepID=UPI001EE7C2E0
DAGCQRGLAGHCFGGDFLSSQAGQGAKKVGHLGAETVEFLPFLSYYKKVDYINYRKKDPKCQDIQNGTIFKAARMRKTL